MKIRSVVITAGIFIAISIYGQESILESATPKTYVNDYANLLDEQQEILLEKKIRDHESQSSNQITIVTIKSLDGYAISDLAHRLAERWGVGQKNSDNGILILIKPKYKNDRGQVYIAVGYGLEHAVPDIIAKQIVENILIPHFKLNNFYSGLDKALDMIFSYIDRQYINDIDALVVLSNFKKLLIFLGVLTLILPFLYLSYIKKRKVPQKYTKYFISGAYNSENLIKQVELIEKEDDKSYSKFKEQLKKYEIVSRNNLIKYSDKIDRKMFCYLLNGRNRLDVFREMCDPFLKFIMIYLLVFFILISILILLEGNWFAFTISLIFSLAVVYAFLAVLNSLVEILQFTMRKGGKYLGGVSISLFALNALFKKNIGKRIDPRTNAYIYYPIAIMSSGGSFGGGGIGGGGFGGGSFGGGGAGGSW